MKLTIGHLYPELLNLYGDRGNIICMVQRLKWRGIDAEVKEFDLNDKIDFSKLDIVLLGGGSDREQLLVCNRLKRIKKDFIDYVEQGGVVLAICGGYQLLGNYYKMGDETIEGLGVVNIHTERGDSRLISNIVLQSDLFPLPIVGFENHGGRTFIENYQPLGKVLSGHGITLTPKETAETAKTKEISKNLNFAGAIKLAFKNMKEKKMRNILVAVGASIGIMSIMLMLSIGNGIKTYIRDTMESLANPLAIEVTMPEEEDTPAMGPEAFLSNTYFTQEDIDRLGAVEHVSATEEHFSAFAMGTAIASIDDKQAPLMMVSTLSQYNEYDLAEGTMANKNEIIINEAVKEELGMDDIVGKTITVSVQVDNRQIVIDTVVSGVLSDETSPMSGGMSQVYLYYDDLKQACAEQDYDLMPTSIMLIADMEENVDGIKSTVTDMGYGSSMQETMVETFTTMLDLFTGVLAGIAGISLLVSAIMILVVLYISVVERTREIGVMKAIGARRKDIRRIFISESFILGLAGGIIATVITFIIMFIGNAVIQSHFGVNMILISPYYVLFGIGISILISVLSGTLPAAKAAKLDPVESLRRD